MKLRDTANAVILTETRKSDLAALAQSRSLPAGYVFRAKLILLLAEGKTFAAIRQQLATSTPTIIRWNERYLAEGLAGLSTAHPACNDLKGLGILLFS